MKRHEDNSTAIPVVYILCIFSTLDLNNTYCAHDNDSHMFIKFSLSETMASTENQEDIGQ